MSELVEKNNHPKHIYIMELIVTRQIATPFMVYSVTKYIELCNVVIFC